MGRWKGRRRYCTVFGWLMDRPGWGSPRVRSSPAGTGPPGRPRVETVATGAGRAEPDAKGRPGGVAECTPLAPAPAPAHRRDRDPPGLRPRSRPVGPRALLAPGHGRGLRRAGPRQGGGDYAAGGVAGAEGASRRPRRPSRHLKVGALPADCLVPNPPQLCAIAEVSEQAADLDEVLRNRSQVGPPGPDESADGATSNLRGSCSGWRRQLATGVEVADRL